MKNESLITCIAERESLPVFREFIDNECKKREIMDRDTCYDLKLAVDEACTNIITHGYAGMTPGSIILSLQTEPGQVVVTITDFGHPFEPVEPIIHDMEADLDDWPEGGLGLFFMYQAMDQIRYEKTENGNRLILVKRLSANQ